SERSRSLGVCNRQSTILGILNILKTTRDNEQWYCTRCRWVVDVLCTTKDHGALPRGETRADSARRQARESVARARASLGGGGSRASSLGGGGSTRVESGRWRERARRVWAVAGA